MPGSASREQNSITCVVLTTPGRQAPEDLITRLAGRGVTVKQCDDPVEAMVELALLDIERRHLRTLALLAGEAVGGAIDSGAILLVVEPKAWDEELDLLLAALRRRLPGVAVWGFDGRSRPALQPLSAPGAGQPRRSDQSRQEAPSPADPASNARAGETESRVALRTTDPAAPSRLRPQVRFTYGSGRYGLRLAGQAPPTPVSAAPFVGNSDRAEDDDRPLVSREELAMLLDDGGEEDR